MHVLLRPGESYLFACSPHVSIARAHECASVAPTIAHELPTNVFNSTGIQGSGEKAAPGIAPSALIWLSYDLCGSTGPYYVDTMWKLYTRKHRGCRHMLNATVLTHDEWQRRHLGVHHWLSTWKNASDSITSETGVWQAAGAQPVVDEGLLDWLGVNRSADCGEATLHTLFNQSGGRISLRTQLLNAYRAGPNRSRRFRYTVTVVGVGD